MLTLLDYGLGNLNAFVNIYKQLNIPYKLAQCQQDLEDASKIILPGVGAFDYAMNLFNKSGMRDKVDYLVLEKKIPVMGICVGMQMMAKSSEEGDLNGLSWFDATVKRMSFAQDNGLLLPHMGWNNIEHKDNRLFENLVDPIFYFLHSYYFSLKSEDQILATAVYSNQFTAVAGNENIYGVQFHPEKSHKWGIQILKNFAELV
jgi:glutamine amidotransferase